MPVPTYTVQTLEGRRGGSVTRADQRPTRPFAGGSTDGGRGPFDCEHRCHEHPLYTDYEAAVHAYSALVPLTGTAALLLPQRRLRSAVHAFETKLRAHCSSDCERSGPRQWGTSRLVFVLASV